MSLVLVDIAEAGIDGFGWVVFSSQVLIANMAFLQSETVRLHACWNAWAVTVYWP